MKKTWTQWEGNLVDTFFFFFTVYVNWVRMAYWPYLRGHSQWDCPETFHAV